MKIVTIIVAGVATLSTYAVPAVDNGQFVANIGQSATSGGSPVISLNDSLPEVVTSQADSLLVDSLPVDSASDSSLTRSHSYKISKDSLEAPVLYESTDSMFFDVKDQKVYLYGDAKVAYKDITLEAEYIEFDWKQHLIIAYGLNDTAPGKDSIVGSPVFSEKDQEYKAKKITYNYQTKKGKILELITKEGEGYIHGDEIKKTPDDEMYGKHAKYTTCDLEDPHFEIAVSKIKVVPDKVLVAGPSNLVVADVPTPLFIPFGIFPLKKGRKSGILVPEFGDDRQLGYNLRRGGYYFAISDHLDAAVTGDIFSRGSWRTNVASSYAKRYRFKGNVKIDYAERRQGDPITPNFSKTKDFLIDWYHKQDPKARPNSNFAADVHAGTSSFHQNNSLDFENRLTNTYRSSVSYTNSLPGTPFNLTASLGHSQNTKTRIVDLTLPSIALNMNRLYPFKRKVIAGSKKWYESISVGYTGNAKNQLTVADSLLFDEDARDFRNGAQHKVPVTTSFKVLKYFTINPRIDYTERWYWKTIQKEWVDDGDTAFLDVRNISSFKAARDFNTNITATTNLYGLVSFKKGKLRAVRHVFTPSFGLSYRPDFSDPQWGYYDSVQVNSEGDMQQYSFFDGGIYGKPPSGKRGGINLSVQNNLQAKIFSKKDTIKNEKRIVLLEALSASTFYNAAEDSLQWDPISVRARTNLYKYIRLIYNSTFIPYDQDSLGRQISRSEWDAHRRVARLKNQTLEISTSGLRFDSKKLQAAKNKTSDKGSEEELAMINEYPDEYVDFNVPWSASLGYSLTLRDKRDEYDAVNNVLFDTITVVQSLNLNFDLSLTPKWKLDVRSGYDFVNKEITYTTVNIHRDLHCWQMKFTWIPFGERQGYSFSLNVKAAVLQDLKLNKKRNWYGS